MFDFFKRKKKESYNCLGVYRTKQYPAFKYGMNYAGDTLILENNKISVYSRIYKKTRFVFTFVDDETDFDKSKYNYAALKNEIDSLVEGEHDSVVNLVIFKNKNEKTISIAKEVPVNTKTEFNQTLVYDGQMVWLEYYRPVPDFYSLYSNYAEAIFFDLGAIDPTR